MAFLQLCEETEVSPWVSGCKTLVVLPEGSVSHLVYGVMEQNHKLMSSPCSNSTGKGTCTFDEFLLLQIRGKAMMWR